MRRLTSEVIDIIERNKLEETKFLQDLITKQSTLGKEKTAQGLIIEKFRRINLAIDMWEPSLEDIRKKFPNFMPFNLTTNYQEYKDRVNVVGLWKGTGAGRSIILNGHVDVVDPGPKDAWKHDPWSGISEDGNIYGRGACDMKGGITAAIFAVEAIQKAGLKLKGDVLIESVIDEEGGSIGTFACIARGYKADAGVVMEPSNLEIHLAQAGLLRFKIRVEGKVAHGGLRNEGVSALEKAVEIYHALTDLELYRVQTKRHELFLKYSNPVPINVGVINSGTLYSVVPGEAIMEGRYGLLPGETYEDAMKQFEEQIAMVSKSDPWMKDHPPRIEWFLEGSGALPPCEISANQPIAQIAISSLEEVIGKKATISAAYFGTDASLLNAHGNTPTLVFGPGDSKYAHFPNEYVPMNDLITATKALAGILLNWCGIKQNRKAHR